MKKKFFLWTLLITGFLNAVAQTDSSFSLKQCIDYALANSAAVKNATLDEYIANAKVGEIRAMGLPQITASASVVDNPALRRMFFKGDNPFFSNGAGGGVYDPNEVYGIPNFFQLRSTGDVSATINQLIFSGSYIVGLQASKTFKELSVKSSEKTKIEVIESIKKAYYLILISKERLDLLNSNIGRLDTLLKQTKALLEGGFVEKVDVFRLEVTYNNLITEKQKADNMFALGYLQLKFQMGMPVNQRLNLKGNISEINTDIAKAAAVKNTDYNKRIEYSLLQTQKNANLLQLRNVRAGYLPTLAAFGTLGSTNSDYKVSRLFNHKWYPYNMYGFSLSMPLFEGGTKYYKAQQAKLELKKTENDLINLQNGIDVQVKQAEINLKNSVQTLESQKRNLELSNEVIRIAKLKYQEGVGSNLEIITAENSLKEAQTNYYSALYDVVVSNIDYQKSIGTLNNE